MPRDSDRPTLRSTFEKTKFVMSKKVLFKEAFPQIADIEATVTQPGRGLGGYDSSRTLTKTNPPGEYEDCNNPECCNGGVRIGEMLREMVENRQTQREFETFCPGYEGSPKGRRKYRRCGAEFKVRIKITYAAAAS